MTAHSRLQYLPISFFSAVMGLCGLAIALQSAGPLWRPFVALGDSVALLATATFGLLALLYALKLARYRAEVRAELSDPVKMSFGATVTVSLILLGITLLPIMPAVSEIFWMIGAVLHLAYTLYAVNSWFYTSGFDIQHISPAWFIPAVGNILVPVVGVVHAVPDVSWFFFSIGLLFWMMLFTIIVYRMIFHYPLPDRLLPTLFILIAPPAVGFISYIKLTGSLDAFGRLLYFSSLFITLLLFLQLPRFLRLPFHLSWWAYSFPLAAITAATLLMHTLNPLPLYTYIAWVLLGILGVVVIYLALRTLRAITRGQICVADA